MNFRLFVRPVIDILDAVRGVLESALGVSERARKRLVVAGRGVMLSSESESNSFSGKNFLPPVRLLQSPGHPERALRTRRPARACVCVCVSVSVSSFRSILLSSNKKYLLKNRARARRNVSLPPCVVGKPVPGKLSKR